MITWQRFSLRPPWRTFLLLLASLALAYSLWTPGTDIIDGRHDLRNNGIWLQHGWLGDDTWFERDTHATRPYFAATHAFRA